MAKIPVSTTEVLPSALGGSREIKRIQLAEVWDYRNPQLAIEALADWGAKNGYNAIIGVRFLAYSNVSAPTVYTGSGAIKTEALWTAYGTAIGW